ncbi:uncharacterized protein LOC131951627, partial [Physella acuta]|uniref:uncharacterized protein LOC131951627 n=1 Tax=Physella acuta TaxID=109671 RepID=UPI0027DD4C4F
MRPSLRPAVRPSVCATAMDRAGTCVLLCVLCLVCSRCEIFSSVAKLKALVKTEEKFLEYLENILEASSQANINTKKFKELRRVAERVRRRLAHLPANLCHSPVSAHLLIRQVYHDWQTIVKPAQTTVTAPDFLEENVGNLREAISKWPNWVSESDIEGSALGLVRIAEVYNIIPAPSWFNATPTHRPIERCLACQNFVQLDIGTLPLMCPIIDKHHGRHDYRLFAAIDYLVVMETAVKFGLYEEAFLWLNWFEVNVCPGQPSHVIRRSRSLRQSLSSQSRQSLANQDGFRQDEVQAQFTKLCQRSTRGSQRSTRGSHPAEQDEQSRKLLTCHWRFVWPYYRFKAELLNVRPALILYHDVISSSEIQHMQEQAVKKLAPSELPNRTATSTLIRSSQTAWLDDDTATLHKLSMRVGQITGLDTRRTDHATPAEPFQVLNYGAGGVYRLHTDSVKLSRDLGKENISALQDAGDRLATWMFYVGTRCLLG